MVSYRVYFRRKVLQWTEITGEAGTDEQGTRKAKAALSKAKWRDDGFTRPVLDGVECGPEEDRGRAKVRR